jgi:alcohol dehydrogenase YqhD (iron-dependent ADH family)
MQSNQNIEASQFHIIEDAVWSGLYQRIRNKAADKGTEKDSEIHEAIQEISQLYNIDKKNLLKYFINYLLRNHKEIVCPEFMRFVENIMHFQDCNNAHYINYFLAKMTGLLRVAIRGKELLTEALSDTEQPLCCS